MKACTRPMPSASHQGSQGVGLVLAGNRLHTVQVGRRDPVDRKHAIALQIQRKSAADQGLPPAGSGVAVDRHHVATGRDAALHDHRWGIRGATPQVAHIELARRTAVLRRDRDAAGATLGGEVRPHAGTGRGNGGGGGRKGLRLAGHLASLRSASTCGPEGREERVAAQEQRGGADLPSSRGVRPRRCRRNWHRRGRVSAGCPGFKGPVPPPVSMSGENLYPPCATVNRRLNV